MGRLRIYSMCFLLTAVSAAFLASCSVTKNLAEDEYILNKNKILVDKKAPEDERISARELGRYVRQSPAPKLLGINFPIWVYNQADPGSDNGWNNFLRQLGSEPVILDTALTQVSAENIKLYMSSRGFRESECEYEITYKPKNQRARVTYSVTQGEPYRIGEITYDFRDKFLEQVISEDNDNTLLRSGDLFDTNVLDHERTRIAAYLRDRGYYNFSVDNISYTAYTDPGDHVIDLRMTVRQHLAGYDRQNNPVMENNAVYRISGIYVFPDHDPLSGLEEEEQYRYADTLSYQGLSIVTEGRPPLRPAALRRAVNLYSGDIYSLSDTRRAVENIMQLGMYKNANIIFSEVPLEGDEYVTYVGGETGEEAQHTVEKQLVCNIYCTPNTRQNYSVDFEGTITERFYGIKTNLNYQSRNLLRGAELFDLGMSGGYEFFKRSANSFELGANVGLSFPRFITPFPVDRANRAVRPVTRLDASVNMQNRPDYYRRTITGLNLTYSWSDGKKNSYTVKPLAFSLVKSSLQQDFEDELEAIGNDYLIESYRSLFIPAITASHTYSNQTINLKGHSLTVKTNLETAGNLSTLISDNVGQRRDTATVFGVNIAQYARGDVSVGYRIPLWEGASLASRIFLGIGIPYGNSSSMPIDRMYYAGGANSMRGWQVRTLGPGASPVPENAKYPMQTGDMRLEANLELRFPVSGSLHGALFFDAGNVWMVRQSSNPEKEIAPEAIFKFNNFYRQLGFNTGVGLRVDIGLVVFRLDWGIQLFDPGRTAGQKWINGFRWADTALSFGVGYPF